MRNSGFSPSLTGKRGIRGAGVTVGMNPFNLSNNCYVYVACCFVQLRIAKVNPITSFFLPAAPMGKLLKIPKEVLPVIFAKLFSSSAATGFLLDIYKTSGADSLAGFMSSVILSSTETCFYTLSVYYSVVGIKKIRYTLTGALLAVFVGTFISVFISYF